MGDSIIGICVNGDAYGSREFAALSTRGRIGERDATKSRTQKRTRAFRTLSQLCLLFPSFRAQRPAASRASFSKYTLIRARCLFISQKWTPNGGDKGPPRGRHRSRFAIAWKERTEEEKEDLRVNGNAREKKPPENIRARDTDVRDPKLPVPVNSERH